MGIEFYQFENEVWYRTDDGDNKLLLETSTEIIKKLIEIIREYYPESYSALETEYSKSSLNISYFQYLIVRRFCKCNFGRLDSTQFDIREDTILNFEKVDCPLRGECKFERVICCPKFNSKLSNAEKRVMKLVYHGFDNNKIAEQLYISPHTVKQHIKAAYTKLKIHGKSEFIRYANKNKMFNN